MAFTLLAAYYPLIWLAPPYMQFTPYLYVIASLGWLPFLWLHVRRLGSNWIIIFLIVGCLGAGYVLSTIVSARADLYNDMTCQRMPDNTLICYTGRCVDVFSSVGDVLLIKRSLQLEGYPHC
jgi:hypothetical protein